MALKFQLHEYRRKPVIAILTMDDGDREFRGNRGNFIDLIHAGKEQRVLVYVTTVKDMNFNSSLISGYTFDTRQNQWLRQSFPFPHVVYNRIPYRKHETLSEVRQVMDGCVKHPHIHFFNPSFFNKWELFEWLNKSRATRGYVPITIKWSDDIKLLPLMKQYAMLYLKPEKGKAGAGIMRIRRNPKGKIKYFLSVQVAKKSKTIGYQTLDKMKEKIRELTGDKAYIIQQGIGLAHNHQRPFDLRVLAQKNHLGKWTVTGIGGRVAGELSITTHVPRGGSIDDPKALLKSVFGARSGVRIFAQAGRAAMLIARQIEKGAGAPLGEMSMDLGVDGTGRIWFFEANAKPMKFDEPHIRKKSLNRFIQYCVYLTKPKGGR